MMRFLVALLALSLLASGCGGHEQSKADRAAMNAEFARIDFGIAQSTMGPGYANQKRLEALTRRYVAATRKYKDDLGDAEINRRLARGGAGRALVPPLRRNHPSRSGIGIIPADEP